MTPPFAYAGELAALATAFFWTITALSFEMASKRIGSLAVNILRLLFAFVFLGGFNWFYRGHPFPVDASIHNWMWLILSGLVGFVFGDYCLFKSYTLLSARVSMLIMTLVASVLTPSLWLHPLGPLTKHLALTAALWTLARNAP